MINGKLLKKVRDKIENIKNINKLYKIEKEKIDTINLDNVEIKKDKKYGFIDSSYVNGIIGPYTYVYTRAVIVSEDLYDKIDDIEFFENTFIKSEVGESFDITDISSMLAKNLEYKLAKKYYNRYIFIDGSIISDGILYSKFCNKFDDLRVEERRKEFIENFEFLLNNGNLLAVAKRILNLDIIKSGKSDMIILMNTFPNEIFYTNIFETDFNYFFKGKIPEEKLNLFNKKIMIMYFRARYNDHIYRIEGLDKIGKDNFLEIIKENIYLTSSYPRYLKLAHNECKITNREKNLLESYIKKLLGFEESVGWDTH
ncbi:hypothetical protein YN1_3260 [Nanoarchaeota archaeon]